jgi:RNA polymerase sigma factor (sigma-70 family)
MNEQRADAADRPVTHRLEDSDLLRRYAETGSEEAFAELVRRRIDVVYSVALRQTGGNRHRAEDATQAVFADLARKARALAARPVLVGWLYRSAQFAAAGLVRAEQRRQAREQEAHTMETLLKDQPHDADWQKLRPVLDEVLSEIDERDRDAILLRFFDGRPFAEIGERLRLTENAARMRVERALDQLNAALAKRGITSTTAALGAALGTPIAAATPAGLAAAVTGSALTQMSVGAGSWVATFFGASKLQLGIAGAVAAAGIGGYAVQANANSNMRRELAALRVQQLSVAALRNENQQLAANVAEVELLRRDDAEFKQLDQKITEVRKANEERTRLAKAQASQRSTDQNIQAEIDRMNREGNRLVEEYKALNVRANDSAQSADERAKAAAAAKQKLADIQAKQREVQAFIAAAKAANPQFVQEGRRGASVPGEITARKTLRDDANRESAGQSGWSYEPERMSLRLPQADLATVLSALETITGLKIVRDPSLASVRRPVDLQTNKTTKEETMRAVTQALQQQLNVVLETNPDGSVVAKVGPPR